MIRRRAITIAGTVATSLAAATLAVGANFGLLGFARSDSSSLGELEADVPIDLAGSDVSTTPPTTATSEDPEVIVRYEDVYVPGAPAPAPVPATAVAPPSTAAPRALAPEDQLTDDDDDTTATTVEACDDNDPDEDDAIDDETCEVSTDSDRSGVEADHEDEYEGETDDD